MTVVARDPDAREQRAVGGGCVPYQEDLMERPRRRRLPDKRALVKQLLCSAKMASGNGVGTGNVGGVRVVRKGGSARGIEIAMSR